jgi:hypothetical protein
MAINIFLVWESKEISTQIGLPMKDESVSKKPLHASGQQRLRVAVWFSFLLVE